ncbi:MAG: hypothetical protein AABX77_02700, partial [Nanoarchaeota archaeon]
ITNPAVNNSNTTDTSLDVNFSLSDPGVGVSECWYSNDSYLINRSLVCGNNLTNITWSTQQHNVTIYANDTLGNLNSSSISFNISTSSDSGSSGESGGGGGGGGGSKSASGVGGGSSGTGAAIITKSPNLVINPKILEISTVVGRMTIKEIEIFNKGNINEKIKIEIKSLQDIVDIGDLQFTLDSGKKRKIRVRITSLKTGVYTGKIIINGQEILTSINVQSEDLFFNVNLSIPKEYKTINSGEKLKGSLKLIPTEVANRTKVTVNYIIRDYEGNKYITESETLFIDNIEEFEKEFNLEKLEPGNYLLSTELVYVNGFAISSSNFEVKRKLSKVLVLTLLISGILLLTIINIIILRLFRKLRRLREIGKMKRYKR